MALVNFKQSTETKILSAPISDGTFYVSTDTKKLYVDIDTKRVEVSANTNTTYVLSKSGSTITLRGSDGSTYNITDANTTYANATDSASGLMSAADKAKLDGIAAQANKVVVDASLSDSSTNPVQNKVIKAALDGKASSVHSHTKSQITDFPTSMPASDVHPWAKAATKPAYTATEVGAAAASHKHNAADLTSGTLGVDRLPSIPATKLTGTIAAANLPAYVDDVLEFANKTAFPSTGEGGKIYVAQDINKTYRWGGTAYVEISPSLALGTTSSTAFRGDYGNTAYQHAVAKGSAFASGLYKITTNAQGHVTEAQAITKSDITALGIPAQDTNTWIAMKGASASATGGAGYVPAPTTGQQNLFLRGDGTWAQGPVGPKGDKGATGDRGPQGIQGPQGPKGDKVEVKVDDTTISRDAEQRLQVKDGGITSAKVAESAINASHIADGAVGTAELAAGAVSTDKVADRAITPAKISDPAAHRNAMGLGNTLAALDIAHGGTGQTTIDGVRRAVFNFPSNDELLTYLGLK